MKHLLSDPSPVAAFAGVAGKAGSILLDTQRPHVGERYSCLLISPKKVLSTFRSDIPDELHQGYRFRRVAPFPRFLFS